MTEIDPVDSDRRVHPTIVWLASYAWRLLVIAAAAIGLLLFIGRLPVLFMALVITVLLSRILVPVANRLRQHMPPAIATAITLVGFLLTAGTALALIGIAVVNAAEDIGPTVSRGIDDIERWVVEDSPFPVDRRDVTSFRRDFGSRVGGIVASFGDGSNPGSGVVTGVRLFFEAVLAVVLGLVFTFFAVKDGRRFTDWVARRLPEERRPLANRMGDRAWSTIGGYLRGAAILGTLEGIIIAVTLMLVGSDLAVAMGALTFFGAFVPFVGAVVAGVLSVLVALATAGPAAAAIVALVAILVQQFDNDLLAPVIYGRALSLHPVVILTAITAGGSLFGLIGAFIAVPLTAVVINAWSEMRDDQGSATADRPRS